MRKEAGLFVNFQNDFFTFIGGLSNLELSGSKTHIKSDDLSQDFPSYLEKSGELGLTINATLVFDNLIEKRLYDLILQNFQSGSILKLKIEDVLKNTIIGNFLIKDFSFRTPTSSLETCDLSLVSTEDFSIK